MGNTFNTGIIFYYWPRFNPKQNQDEKEVEDFTNIIDYSGFSKNQLFIEKGKYHNLKEEALNSGYCSLPVFSKKVDVKSRELFHSTAVKKMQAKVNARDDQATHYGIEQGQKILLEHLQSVILYTDFSDLCTAFSS
eukprot:548370_1